MLRVIALRLPLIPLEHLVSYIRNSASTASRLRTEAVRACEWKGSPGAVSVERVSRSAPIANGSKCEEGDLNQAASPKREGISRPTTLRIPHLHPRTVPAGTIETWASSAWPGRIPTRRVTPITDLPTGLSGTHHRRPGVRWPPRRPSRTPRRARTKDRSLRPPFGAPCDDSWERTCLATLGRARAAPSP